jgi:hypothetical protein
MSDIWDGWARRTQLDPAEMRIDMRIQAFYRPLFAAKARIGDETLRFLSEHTDFGESTNTWMPGASRSARIAVKDLTDGDE